MNLTKNFELVKAIKKTNNEILKQENEIVRKYGLTTSQYGVLECLYRKGEMCINDLIKNQISTSGTMTVIVRNLEKLGYILKMNDDKDKRIYKVSLTKKGNEIVKKIFPERELQLNEFADTLSEKQKEQLLEILYVFKNKYKNKEVKYE